MNASDSARDGDRETVATGVDADNTSGGVGGGDGALYDRPRRGIRGIVRNDDGTSYAEGDDEVAEFIEALKNVEPGPECDWVEREIVSGRWR